MPEFFQRNNPTFQDTSGNILDISQNLGYTNVYPMATLSVMTLRTKDAGMRLRIEKELRQDFNEACRLVGRPAAQVLREFMRDFVARETAALQRGLFDERAAVRNDQAQQ